MNHTINLYQFPISHYCEKVRWALDYKQLENNKVCLLPGLYHKKTLQLAKRSSVPILEHNGNIIQNSADIITYLDDIFLDYPLSPLNQDEKQKSLDWEAFANKEIGLHVRILMLPHLT